MREIVLDTETTGLDPAAGHRLVEIGAVELINKVATGQRYHVYMNPERDMPDEAFRVHGLSSEFLADKPVFLQVASDFLAFIADAPLVIHNAEFDIRFLDHELTAAGLTPLGFSRAVDTLALARRKHPGASNSLDSLCARYGINASHRTLHGALLDANLLALVYLELCGGMQSSFALPVAAAVDAVIAAGCWTERPVPLARPVDAGERAAHAGLVESLGSAAVWHRYLKLASSAA